ncbi:Plant regulator RWP-RK family protein [Rhynchospora pubera]|uniref:Plant regulator RWP-RK family protein n=1 Tax=Rhynchospora pubera TaxID=906938 RepID=A0AAV8C7X4_9POAL|nr:Plant regulator RWP-RK family protein [Rhynchospora pubera]
MDGFVPLDDAGSPMPDDPLALSALLNLDEYSDLGTGSMSDPVFPSTGYPAPHHVHTNWHASEAQDSVSTNLSSSSEMTQNEGAMLQFMLPSDQLGLVPVPKSTYGVSLHERMMRALSLLKEMSEAGILAQFWMPIKQGGNRLLTTSDQPHLFDQTLAGYREVSRKFTFAAKETPGLYPGLPGRVYISGLPEWTPNVLYYKKVEYLRSDYAANHEVRGSLAVPVFGTDAGSCCAVLEIVTTKEKPDFDREMDIVCMALQSVSLRTVKAKERPRLQSLMKNQKAVYTEISQLLETVCQAHSLPLALTWVPLKLANGEIMLSVHEPSCYVYTTNMHGFLHTCTETSLEEGQGMVGRALRSNRPFFSSDVRDLNICEYPLAHHARKYGLRAAVAIRLRSAHTGDSDYILELFFPVDCCGAYEQQVLLNSLSGTMQRLCKSLRTVSDSEIRIAAVSAMSASNFSIDYFAAGAEPERHHRNGSMSDLNFEQKGIVKQEDMGSTIKLKMSSTSQLEKKRSIGEKSISMSTLRQHFSGSLKDAAKSIGVCPTTLKRICRQHGISRWPSRKINKVNRSLKKIQNMINSVDGFEGTLKYDPATGSLITAIASPENTIPSTHEPTKPDPLLCFPSHNFLHCEQPFPKLEPDSSPIYGNPLENFAPILKAQLQASTIAEDAPSSSSMTDSGSGSASSLPSSYQTIENNPSLTSQGNSGLVVKATYKHDTIRFKLHPNLGYGYVVEEVSKRFKLPIGLFQLKYKDDEDEWVVLACDSDLQECIEITQHAYLHSVRLQVLDVRLGEGSSSGSCSWLAGQ